MTDKCDSPTQEQGTPTTEIGGKLGRTVQRVDAKLAESTLAEQYAEQLKYRDQESEAQVRRRRLARFDRSVGARYAKASLDNFETRGKADHAVLCTLITYSTRMDDEVAQGNGILLYGPAGTGKDHLLVGLARQAIMDHGLDVGFASGVDLFMLMRAAIKKGSDERDVLKVLVAPDILLLSDPAPPRGAVTDYQAQAIYQVVDARYRAMRPTWVSLNVKSSQDADDRLGPQAVDRLTHGALVLKCEWPSYRRARD